MDSWYTNRGTTGAGVDNPFGQLEGGEEGVIRWFGLRCVSTGCKRKHKHTKERKRTEIGWRKTRFSRNDSQTPPLFPPCHPCDVSPCDPNVLDCRFPHQQNPPTNRFFVTITLSSDPLLQSQSAGHSLSFVAECSTFLPSAGTAPEKSATTMKCSI